MSDTYSDIDRYIKIQKVIQKYGISRPMAECLKAQGLLPEVYASEQTAGLCAMGDPTDALSIACIESISDRISTAWNWVITQLQKLLDLTIEWIERVAASNFALQAWYDSLHDKIKGLKIDNQKAGGAKIKGYDQISRDLITQKIKDIKLSQIFVGSMSALKGGATEVDCTTEQEACNGKMDEVRYELKRQYREVAVSSCNVPVLLTSVRVTLEESRKTHEGMKALKRQVDDLLRQAKRKQNPNDPESVKKVNNLKATSTFGRVYRECQATKGLLTRRFTRRILNMVDDALRKGYSPA